MDPDQNGGSHSLQLEGGTLELEEGGADSLDWSVSGISGTLDPDRFHTELSSSSSSTSAAAPPIPATVGLLSPLATAAAAENTQLEAGELLKLADQFKAIQANLQHISEKSTTPVNSPRPGSSESHKVEPTTVNVTPPVKDPGPGGGGVGLVAAVGGMESSRATPSRIPTLASVSKSLDFRGGDREQAGGNGGATRVHQQPLPEGGIGGSNQAAKLDQMRSVLKDLEGTAIQIRSSSDSSKIPVIRNRLPSHQQANNDTSSSAAANAKQSNTKDEHVTAVGKSPFLEKEFEEMNAFLDQVKRSSVGGGGGVGRSKEIEVAAAVSKPSQNWSKGNNNNDNTLTNHPPHLHVAIEQQQEKAKVLESTVAELKAKVLSLEGHISTLESSNAQKQTMLSDLKSQWSDALKNWSKNQQELVEQLQSSRTQVDQLKLENASAKEQFLVCQDELGKAVKIASDFRQKLSEEEAVKQDMLSQLLSERASKSKQLILEQAKQQKTLHEKESLVQEINRLRDDNLSLVNSSAELSKKLHDQDMEFSKERASLEKTIKELGEEQKSLQKEQKTTESSLHTFYASQMESILSEKIEALQVNVKLWEKNLLRDKQDALARLQNQHDAQVEHIKKTLFDGVARRHQDEIEELRLALAASRKEADALREQLNLHQLSSSKRSPPPPLSLPFPAEASLLHPTHHRQNSSSNIQSSKERQEQIWREILASSKSRSSASRNLNGLAMVQNNLYEETPSLSAATNGGHRVNEATSYQAPPSSESSPILTKEEKRHVVSGFIKEYLDENPNAVSDAQLMSRLNSMAMNLVERTLVDSSPSAGERLNRHRGRRHRQMSQNPIRSPSPQQLSTAAADPPKTTKHSK